MSKKSLKKIIINNKLNSSKIIEKKKALLKSFQCDNNNIIDDNYDNHINQNFGNWKNFKINGEINELNNLDNKENYFMQNIKQNENKSNQEINYLIKKNQINNKDNDNENNLKTYKKLHNLNYYNIKKNNMILTYPNQVQNDNSSNSSFNLNIQKGYNNYKIKNNKKQNNIIINNDLKNDEGYLTSRFIENSNNQKIIRIINTKNYLNNKALTDRNHDLIYKNKKFLLPENKSGKKTLILDLDETLIHSSFKPFKIKDEIALKIKPSLNNNNIANEHYIIYMLKRPYVGLFLSIVCDIFEVVIFTASVPDYANAIINEIDTENKIKYRLFREHCIKIDKDKYIKNLYSLGRDLKNVIIIDNNPLSYTLNIENGLPISSWETNINDNELIKLIPLLQYISQRKIFDVRPIIKKVAINNIINYDEINKIINYRKTNYIDSSNEKENIEANEDKQTNIKENKPYKNKITNSLYQKLESYNNDINKNNKNNDSYYLNNSQMSNNPKKLKNICINKGNELFIKKLRIINEDKYGEKLDIQKSKSFNYFKEKDLKNNMLINKIRRYNLSEKYLLNKQNKKNENENNNKEIYEKKDLKYSKKTYNNKSKNNKTYIENRKADIPIPNNNNYIIPIYRNNIKNKNKLIPKNHNIIYLKKKDSHKCLIKNNSDFGYVNKSNSKDEKRLIINRLQYPSLKDLLYYKIFPNKYNDIRTRNKNNKKISINNSINKNKAISIDKIQNQIVCDDSSGSKDAYRKQNYSMENYLNNKFHLKISNENLDNFIKRLKMKYQQKTVSEYKNINIELNEKMSKDKNNELIIHRNIYKSFNDTNSLKDSQSENKIVKHSFSFLINKKKDIDYISIINRYKRKTNK